MKAAVYEKYGKPAKVLHIEEVDKPVPRDDQVLIKVVATSINVEDLDFLKGTSWSVRILGPLKPKYHVLGFDVAGTVEAVGKDVTQFKPGDQVMGDLFGYGFGGFAEYVCAPEKAIFSKPENLTFQQASTVPSRAILALQGLRGKRRLQRGQKVLINGAGGGVGPFAVQLAKHFGAKVTAVDHTEKLDFLRSLGSDFVVDYTKEDFTKTAEKYDLIFDISAKHSVFSCRRALKPDGVYILLGGSRSVIFQVIFLGMLMSRFGNKKMGLVPWKPNNKEDLKFLKQLIESNKIVPVIDRRFPLTKVAEAFRYFEEGFPKGKIVVEMNNK